MRITSIFLLIITLSSLGQVEVKLEYPVVPIYDSCHKAFDNEDSLITISKENFITLDRIWTTINTCFNYSEDTVNASTFEVIFCDLFGEPTSMFLVTDGHLHSEYQSSLNDQRHRLKSHDRIKMQNIRFEREGALHQVPNLEFVIDSLVKPELLPCWQLFPMKAQFHFNVTKDQLLTLLNDSFGWNSCDAKKQWINGFHKATMTIYPSDMVINYRAHVPIRDYEITNSEDLEVIKEEIEKLDFGDYIHFDQTIYQKEGKYYYTQPYRFRLIDTLPCDHSINIEAINTDSLLVQLQILSLETSPKNVCLINKNNELVNYTMIFAPKKGIVRVIASTNGTFTGTMLELLKTAKLGDQILLEKIKVPRTGEMIKPLILVIH